ncbi:MAG: hypothetical protein MPW14_02590 [Candidatus Manganitrophus sp.]|nr:MAG: hypothetical protein MPW14_02590 [Candidatus Manganitrophus sp.]
MDQGPRKRLVVPFLRPEKRLQLIAADLFRFDQIVGEPRISLSISRGDDLPLVELDEEGGLFASQPQNPLFLLKEDHLEDLGKSELFDGAF